MSQFPVAKLRACSFSRLLVYKTSDSATAEFSYELHVLPTNQHKSKQLFQSHIFRCDPFSSSSCTLRSCMGKTTGCCR